MSRKEWIGVIAVLGLGVVWQIPGHGGAMRAISEPQSDSVAGTRIPEQEGASPTETAAEVVGPYRTIALEVTGMT